MFALVTGHVVDAAVELDEFLPFPRPSHGYLVRQEGGLYAEPVEVLIVVPP